MNRKAIRKRVLLIAEGHRAIEGPPYGTPMGHETWARCLCEKACLLRGLLMFLFDINELGLKAALAKLERP